MGKLKKLFRNEKGFRLVWRLIIGGLAYALPMAAVIGGLGWAFGRLFDAWGLTNDNLAYAPLWARMVVSMHTDFVYALAYGASILAGCAAAKRLGGNVPGKGCIRPAAGAALGLAMAAGLTLVALLADSMRMEHPMGEPNLTLALAGALIALALGKLSAEVLTRRIVFDLTRTAGRRWLAYLLSVMASVALTAAWNHPLGVINAVLMGLLGCVLYERGGLRASALMQIAWAGWSALVFGFPGMAASANPVYALYHVSDAWLTGGNAGPLCGAWTTVFCMALLVWLCRKEIVNDATKAIKRRSSHGKDQNRNRRSGFKR